MPAGGPPGAPGAGGPPGAPGAAAGGPPAPAVPAAAPGGAKPGGDAKASVKAGMKAKGAGKMEEAAAKFNEALQIDPNSEDANWGLAWVLAMQGKKAEAIKYYERVLALHPGDANACTSILVTKGASKTNPRHRPRSPRTRSPSRACARDSGRSARVLPPTLRQLSWSRPD